MMLLLTVAIRNCNGISTIKNVQFVQMLRITNLAYVEKQIVVGNPAKMLTFCKQRCQC